MDRGTWWATIHGVTQSQTQLKRLSTQHAQYLEMNAMLFSFPSQPKLQKITQVSSW